MKQIMLNLNKQKELDEIVKEKKSFLSKLLYLTNCAIIGSAIGYGLHQMQSMSDNLSMEIIVSTSTAGSAYLVSKYQQSHLAMKIGSSLTTAGAYLGATILTLNSELTGNIIQPLQEYTVDFIKYVQ